MNTELVGFCKKEIDSLLQKGLIKPSKFFYQNLSRDLAPLYDRLKKNQK